MFREIKAKIHIKGRKKRFGSFLSCPHWNYRVGISFPEIGVD